MIEVNRTAHERLGYSREELIGQPLAKIDSPVHAAKIAERVEELSRLGTHTFETEHVSQTGKVIPTEVHARLAHFEEREAVFAVARDITERKQAELALTRSEARYRILFDSIRDAILVADTERRIIDCNTAFSTIFGYTLEEIRGRHVSYVNENQEQFAEIERDIKENYNEHRPYPYTVNYRKKSGEIFPGETGIYYLKDEGGTVNGFVGLIRDITERKETENALKSSEEFQRVLISTSPVAIHGLDVEDRIIVWNESCERVFGWKAEEVLGNTLPTIPEERKQEHRTLFSRVLSGEKLFDIEVERKKKNGELFFGSLSAAPLYNSDGVLRGVVAAMADVTARKKLEEQLRLTQKLEAVGRLAGGIAHDFNNMLMVIKGFSQIVRKKTDPEAAEYGHLMEIEKAVKRAADLTHQLLAYSRKQDLDIVNVDINTVLEASGKMLERLIGEHITVSMVLDHSVPFILADINQLHQMIINLATNARDVMPDGGNLEYIVETAEFSEASQKKNRDTRIIASGTYVLLRVRDTGEGIDEETIAHMFEPFYTTKKIGEGTGLGLATIYGTMKQLNGYIFCTSEKGKGTEFSLYFPAAEGREPEAMELEGAPWSLSGDETILLVEDEEMVRESLSLTLRERGYTVLEAAEGRRAWEYYQERKSEIDLLITDVIMPGEAASNSQKRSSRNHPLSR
ncbi:MAG: PAS domain S-box protein [Spirochaetia bacterium]|nr:PAS domain S-box protein [Spirochaetia bacterium]